MVSIVQFGREWEITTREDYEQAMEVLDSNEFAANMSDDFRREQKELAEIERQRAQVQEKAHALNLIGGKHNDRIQTVPH